jgi:histidine phosphotransfer protein HptB
VFRPEDHDRLLDRDVLQALTEFRVPGEPDPVEDVVDLFLEVTPGRLDELLQAARAHNQPTVRDIAHTLKGSAGMVGANAMQAAAADVEQSAAQPGVESIALAQRLAQLFARTKPALQSLVLEIRVAPVRGDT